MQQQGHGYFPRGSRRLHQRTARSHFIAPCTLAVVLLSCGHVDDAAPLPMPVLRSEQPALVSPPFPIGHSQLQPRTDLELFALEGGPSEFLALYGGGGEIFATRVAADGTVLDPRGILVASQAHTYGMIAATAVGADWLIAYSRLNTSGAYARNEAVVRKLRSDGTFAGEAIPVALDLVAGKLAFDGTRALLLLHSDGPFPEGYAHDVIAVALDTDGNPLGPILRSDTRTRCCNFWNARWPQDIAAKESAFLVAYNYEDQGVIRATADGAFSPPVVLGSTPHSLKGVATDGDRWLALVASRYRELTDDGGVLTTVSEGVLPALNYFDLGFHAGAYTLFAGMDGSTGLFGVRLKPPEVGEPQRLTSGTEGYEAHGVGAATNGMNALVYDGFRIGPLTAEPLSFAPKGPLQLIDSPAWQPRVASNDQCSLVVYADARHYTENPFDSTPRLFATRLGEDGAPLDDHDILIDTRLDDARVVANHHDFLLVGRGDEEQVTTQLVTGAGELGTAQFGPTYTDPPSAASDGDGFIVTFVARRETSPGELEGFLNYFVVSSAGERGAEHEIPSPGSPGEQEIVFNGSEYVVFWLARPADLPPAIYAIRISRSGVLLDTSPRFIAQASEVEIGYHQVEGYLEAAFDGEGYLVTWRVRQDFFDYSIFSARVSSALDAVESTPIILDGDVDIGNEAMRPELFYTSDHYWLLWRNGTVRGSPLVRLLRIERDGTIREPAVELTPFPPGVSGAALVDYDPANIPDFSAAYVGGDRLLVTYDLAVQQTRRIEGRFFGRLLPDGDACRSDRDCQSGTCEAGLCSPSDGGEAGGGGAPAQAGASGESGGGPLEAGAGGDICGAGGSGPSVGGIGGEGAGGSPGASEAGEAGVPGSAASPARGGSGGRAGGAGAGGAGQGGQPARGGSAGTGTGGTSSGPPDDGCSCRMPGTHQPRGAGAFFALIAFGLLLRRRRGRDVASGKAPR